jgi:multidrug efflux system membrane fusion protein
MRSMRWVAVLVAALVLSGCASGKKEDGGEGKGGGSPASGASPKGGGGRDGGGGGGGGRGGRRAQKVPVEVRRVQAYPVEYAVEAVGTVHPFERIEVVARVAGVLEKVSFEEGTRVEKGQKMADIDPARFQLAVTRQKAAHTRALAGLKEAESALARRSKLTKMSGGLVSEEELATAAGKVSVLEAEVAQANVALQEAELDLRESDVRSPVDGVIQARTVQTGQFVARGATLATLLRRDPMLLRFSVAGTEATRLRVGMTVRFVVPGIDAPMTAVISHVAAAADATSRMVDMTARINDPNRDALKPGSFAEVTVPIESQAENPVIPLSAVRPSERGFLAFVFDKGLARERVLKLGLRTPGGQVEVRGGLTPGEMLIVRGTEAVREGVEIEIEVPKKPGAPDTSASASPSTSPNAAPSPEAGGGRHGQHIQPMPPPSPTESPNHKRSSR